MSQKFGPRNNNPLYGIQKNNKCPRSRTTPSIHHGDNPWCHFEFLNKCWYPTAMVWYSLVLPDKYAPGAYRYSKLIISSGCNWSGDFMAHYHFCSAAYGAQVISRNGAHSISRSLYFLVTEGGTIDSMCSITIVRNYWKPGMPGIGMLASYESNNCPHWTRPALERREAE